MGMPRTTARFLLATLFLTAACGAATPLATPTPLQAGQDAPPRAAASSNPVPDAGVNLLIVAEGTVALKRQNWGDYFSTEFGSELRRGDLIRVSGEGEALVLCDSLTTWNVSPGAPAGLNNGCPPPPESMLVRGESLVGNTRAAVDPLIPYVISPRRTKLLSPTPMLRWNPVEGATAYTVSIRGNGVDWSTTTGDTELQYPGEPPLVPGESYALIVEADGGATSRNEGASGLGFTLVNEADAAKIQSAVDQIADLDLTPEAEVLALVQLYAGQGLLADAISSLESLAAQDIPSATVYRHLGDLYRQTGLDEIAGNHYQTAIAKAQATDNVEAQASALEGRAEVMIALGDEAEAVALLEAAKTGYQTLGDATRVAAIQERIDTFTE